LADCISVASAFTAKDGLLFAFAPKEHSITLKIATKITLLTDLLPTGLICSLTTIAIQGLTGETKLFKPE